MKRFLALALSLTLSGMPVRAFAVVVPSGVGSTPRPFILAGLRADLTEPQKLIARQVDAAVASLTAEQLRAAPSLARYRGIDWGDPGYKAMARYLEFSILPQDSKPEVLAVRLEEARAGAGQAIQEQIRKALEDRLANMTLGNQEEAAAVLAELDREIAELKLRQTFPQEVSLGFSHAALRVNEMLLQITASQAVEEVVAAPMPQAEERSLLSLPKGPAPEVVEAEIVSPQDEYRIFDKVLSGRNISRPASDQAKERGVFIQKNYHGGVGQIKLPEEARYVVWSGDGEEGIWRRKDDGRYEKLSATTIADLALLTRNFASQKASAQDQAFNERMYTSDLDLRKTKFLDVRGQEIEYAPFFIVKTGLWRVNAAAYQPPKLLRPLTLKNHLAGGWLSLTLAAWPGFFLNPDLFTLATQDFTVLGLLIASGWAGTIIVGFVLKKRLTNDEQEKLIKDSLPAAFKAWACTDEGRIRVLLTAAMLPWLAPAVVFGAGAFALWFLPHMLTASLGTGVYAAYCALRAGRSYREMTQRLTDWKKAQLGFQPNAKGLPYSRSKKS